MDVRGRPVAAMIIAIDGVAGRRQPLDQTSVAAEVLGHAMGNLHHGFGRPGGEGAIGGNVGAVRGGQGKAGNRLAHVTLRRN
jgi:hypothetical protein